MRSTSPSPLGKESSSVLVTIVARLLVHSLVVVLMTATQAVPGVTAFVRHEHNQYSHRKNQYTTIANTNTNTNTDPYLHIRGGDSDSDNEYDEDTESEEEDETSAGLSAIPATLTKATQKAATKAVKTSVATAMKHTMTKKKKKKKNNNSVITQYLRIPYIVKACFNPFVFYQMTKGYWSSLFSHNYLNDLVRSIHCAAKLVCRCCCFVCCVLVSVNVQETKLAMKT